MSASHPIVDAPIIAHRGASAHAPENTLVAIREAARRGARWVEIDVKLTRDDQPVVIHDDKVDRTSDGTGYVKALSLAQIRGLDAGSWFGTQFAGERIPLFEELLETVLDCGLSLQVELKPTAGDDIETAEVACGVLRDIWPKGRGGLFLSSFSPLSLAQAAVEMPDIPRAFAVVAPPRDARALLARVDCQILHCVRDLAENDEVLRRLDESGVEFAIATINQAESAHRLIAAGAQSVLSDHPDLLSGLGDVAIGSGVEARALGEQSVEPPLRGCHASA